MSPPAHSFDQVFRHFYQSLQVVLVDGIGMFFVEQLKLILSISALRTDSAQLAERSYRSVVYSGGRTVLNIKWSLVM